MIISIIAAIGDNNEIGFKKKLLWFLPDDLKNFHKLTKGHAVVMGRRTYESIGRALPERRNIVITSKTNFNPGDCLIALSKSNAIEICKKHGHKQVFVIGGENIFNMFLPITQILYLTHVHTKIDADSFFPEFNLNEWKLISKKFHAKDDKHEYSFTFKVYNRKIDF